MSSLADNSNNIAEMRRCLSIHDVAGKHALNRLLSNFGVELGVFILGFVSFIKFTILELAIGFKFLFRNRPWQLFLLCAYATYLGHVLIGNVIYTDHWLHLYLLFGIIWGCTGPEYKSPLRNASPISHQSYGKPQCSF